MPRKKTRKVYFGQEVQDAIIRYDRNQIYRDEIHKAFGKLAENIINTFKFTYFDVPFEDVKHEVVAFLVMNIHKYDHTKGSKAFSYFSVVAKNYLILHNNNNYKKFKSHDGIDVLQNKHNAFEQTKQENLIDFVDEMIEYLNENIPTIFSKPADIKIAYAILKLFETRSDIENFNKKIIYLLIREMTGVNTAQITKVVKVMKKQYIKLFNQFETVGTLSPMTSSSTFF